MIEHFTAVDDGEEPAWTATQVSDVYQALLKEEIRKGIVEDDRDTGLENDRLIAFPSPDAAWSRYRAWKGIVDDDVAVAGPDPAEQRAGFVFDGESDLLRNPDDDRSVNVFEPSIRGRTDRIVYRFRKPAR